MTCGGSFDIDKRREQLAELETQMADPKFWDDSQSAQKTVEKNNEIKAWVDEWDAVDRKCSDLQELHELAQMEDDETLLAEVDRDLNALDKSVGDLEFRRMMSHPADKKSAIITIHPGAGGTESADWASMLMRMYVRWAERRGFTVDILDMQEGEEAGIKSVSIEVSGPYAYGYLRAESGVHRLVRISPFDAQKRRHTSFASVFIYPEVDEDIDFKLDDKDIRVDTYRASGAGGQHVNKTDSAVRMTHEPTGIVAQCQSERSQTKNRLSCFKLLTARVYEQHLQELRKVADVLESTKKSIEWGSQIRSYVFQPYQMVKDHRTDHETSNVDLVMDGDIDAFIASYLTQN
jgi:peptide chain release factor 2